MLDRLEYFIALARTGHFGRAAAECGITQPSFSAAIKQLEESLGVLLVRRGSRFQGLTPEGERVLAWARRITSDTRALREEMRAARSGLSGRLRIAAIPTALPMLPRLTAPFRARNPGVTFAILSRTHAAIREMVEDFEADVGVTYLEDEEGEAAPGRLAGVPLYRERYRFITIAGAPLARSRRVTWAEVATQPLGLLTPDMRNRRMIDAITASLGLTVRPVVESNSILALLAQVRAGECATVMPVSLGDAAQPLGDLRAVPIGEPDASQLIGLIASDRDLHTPLVSAFLAHASRLDGRDTRADAASEPPADITA